MSTALALVTFTRIGFHRWPGATPERAYLAQTHRHLFHFTVALEVFHDDREVEFHDLLDAAKAAVPMDGADWGAMSCEMMAREVAKALRDKYGAMRTLRIVVSEDGEVGAELTFQRGE